MKIEELLKEAFLSYEKDNLYDATVYLETILEIDEYNKRALIMLSKIYSSVEKYEIAIKYCEKAYKNYGNELEVIFIMGYLYQEMGKNRKALKNYKKYIEKEKNYHVYLNMGICYMDLKYFRKAHELIDKAIEIDIENPDGYFDKAECFIKMKKFDEAMKLYKKLKNMKIVEDYYIYMKIGDAYYSIKNIEKTIEYYNISINSDFIPISTVYENLYDIFIKEKRYDDVELLLINYYNSNFPKVDSLNLEGKYASYIKDFERAKKVCDKLIMIEPENKHHYINASFTLEKQHKFDEAIEFIEKASEYTEDKEIIKKAKKRIKNIKRRYLKKLEKEE